MRLSPNGSFWIVNENIWRFKLDNSPRQPSPSRENLEIQHDAHAHGDSNFDIIIIEIDSKTDSSENGNKDCVSVCSTEDSILKGNGESTEETNIASLEEDHLPGRPMEANGDTSTISTSTKTKVSEEEKEEEFTKCLRLNSSQDDQQTSSSLCSSSSNSLQLEKLGSLENINDYHWVFPQTIELRRVLWEYKAKKISDDDYVSAIKEEISKVVKLQEELDIDVLVHGEHEV